MSFMFFADETEVPLPPREVRIIEAAARPAPDGFRVALGITLTPFLEYPNLEVKLYRPDGMEERSVSVIGAMDRNLAMTLHVKHPEPGGVYRIVIDLIYDGAVLQTHEVIFTMPEPIG